MRMVEEVSAQLEEKQSISEHHDSLENDKGPPLPILQHHGVNPK